MKKIVLLLYVFFTICSVTAQMNYYVGIPSHIAYIKDSARFVIANLPWNYNGRIEQRMMPYYLEPLKQFMDKHPGFKCNFLLYDCVQSEEMSLAFTTYQAERLREYFLYEDTLFGQQYLNEIIPHGCANPLFKDLQVDSSQRIYRSEVNNSLKSSVIIELIQQYPIQKMIQKSAFYAQPCEGEVFDVAPAFQGGTRALYDYLLKHIDYSVVGQANVSGVVLVEFFIEADGSVSMPEIKRKLFPDLDEQALRIVRNMPRWKPASKNGQAVRCRYKIPLYYYLQ